MYVLAVVVSASLGFPFLKLRESSIDFVFVAVLTEVVKLNVIKTDTANSANVKASKNLRTLAVEHFVCICLEVLTPMRGGILDETELFELPQWKRRWYGDET
jgi:hypothetical protein